MKEPPTPGSRGTFHHSFSGQPVEISSSKRQTYYIFLASIRISMPGLN